MFLSLFLVQCDLEKSKSFDAKSTSPERLPMPSKSLQEQQTPPTKKTMGTKENQQQSLFFDFEKYQVYSLEDTIQIDLDGNGIIEKIFFTSSECKRIIIQESEKQKMTLGCNEDIPHGFPNEVDWVDHWCVVSDSKVSEMLFFENGDVDKDTLIDLERSSIFIGMEEVGGGIITYLNKQWYWVQQAN